MSEVEESRGEGVSNLLVEADSLEFDVNTNLPLTPAKTSPQGTAPSLQELIEAELSARLCQPDSLEPTPPASHPSLNSLLSCDSIEPILTRPTPTTFSLDSLTGLTHCSNNDPLGQADIESGIDVLSPMKIDEFSNADSLESSSGIPGSIGQSSPEPTTPETFHITGETEAHVKYSDLLRKDDVAFAQSDMMQKPDVVKIEAGFSEESFTTVNNNSAGVVMEEVQQCELTEADADMLFIQEAVPTSDLIKQEKIVMSSVITETNTVIISNNIEIIESENKTETSAMSLLDEQTSLSSSVGITESSSKEFLHSHVDNEEYDKISRSSSENISSHHELSSQSHLSLEIKEHNSEESGSSLDILGAESSMSSRDVSHDSISHTTTNTDQELADTYAQADTLVAVESSSIAFAQENAKQDTKNCYLLRTDLVEASSCDASSLGSSSPKDPNSSVDPSSPTDQNFLVDLNPPITLMSPVDQSLPQSPLDLNSPQTLESLLDLNPPVIQESPMELNSSVSSLIPLDLNPPVSSKSPLDSNPTESSESPLNLNSPVSPKSPVDSEIVSLKSHIDSDFPGTPKSLAASDSLVNSELAMDPNSLLIPMASLQLNSPVSSKSPMEPNSPVDSNSPTGPNSPMELTLSMGSASPTEPSYAADPPSSLLELSSSQDPSQSLLLEADSPKECQSPEACIPLVEVPGSTHLPLNNTNSVSVSSNPSDGGHEEVDGGDDDAVSSATGTISGVSGNTCPGIGNTLHDTVPSPSSPRVPSPSSPRSQQLPNVGRGRVNPYDYEDSGSDFIEEEEEEEEEKKEEEEEEKVEVEVEAVNGKKEDGEQMNGEVSKKEGDEENEGTNEAPAQNGDAHEDENTEKKKKKKKRDGDKKSKKKKKDKKANYLYRDDLLEKHVGPRVRSFDANKMKNKFEKPKQVAQVSNDCKQCGKQVFQMEKIVAEKASWHKNCFRCAECNCILTLETYQSHEGILYCKVHFKALFQPKAVLEDPGEKYMSRRPKMIILESQPQELPPDVVRSGNNATDALEDLSTANLKKKFMMFEAISTADEDLDDAVALRRSKSLLNRARGGEEDYGVENSELGEYGLEENEEEEEEEEEEDENEDPDQAKIRKKVKATSFSGMQDIQALKAAKKRKEMMARKRREEVAKFRQMLCAGKNIHTREVFEGIDDFDFDKPVTRKQQIKLERAEAASELRDRFESGEVALDKRHTDERKELEEIFKEADTASRARNLFKQIDSAAKEEPELGQLRRSRSTAEARKEHRLSIDGRQIRNFAAQGEEEEAEEKMHIECSSIQNKFKFFATYEDRVKEADKNRKKVFRFTPPREDEKGIDVEEQELGRDPNYVRCTDNYEDEVDCRKTKSVLAMFRKMEMQNEDGDKVLRPLKQFTPPPEGEEYSDEDEYTDEEYSDEEDSDDDEDEEEDENERKIPKYKDEILEMLSARKAASLRAKFEKWETEVDRNNEFNYNDDEDEECMPSIDTARNLRAMFENKAQEASRPATERPKMKVNRFV